MPFPKSSRSIKCATLSRCSSSRLGTIHRKENLKSCSKPVRPSMLKHSSFSPSITRSMARPYKQHEFHHTVSCLRRSLGYCVSDHRLMLLTINLSMRMLLVCCQTQGFYLSLQCTHTTCKAQMMHKRIQRTPRIRPSSSTLVCLACACWTCHRLIMQSVWTKVSPLQQLCVCDHMRALQKNRDTVCSRTASSGVFTAPPCSVRFVVEPPKTAPKDASVLACQLDTLTHSLESGGGTRTRLYHKNSLEYLVFLSPVLKGDSVTHA